MKVKCMDNNYGKLPLTINKIYSVESCTKSYYYIKNDEGNASNYSKERFEIIEEKESDDMGKYKIYEALKMLEENKNLKFKNKHNEIMEYKQNCVRIFKDNKNIEFYGFVLEDEWELIKQPVTFEEVLNSDKRCKVEHELLDDENEYETFDNLMYFLSNSLFEKELKEIIKNGKWYLED